MVAFIKRLLFLTCKIFSNTTKRPELEIGINSEIP
jgi:hypothetical protein